MKRANFPARKEQRRKEAEERHVVYNKLSIEEKLARNPGSKEMTRLLKQQKEQAQND